MPLIHSYSTSQQGDGHWKVIRSDTHRVASIHTTREDAWKETRRLARGAGSDAVLLSKNGEIRVRNTYRVESDDRG